MQARGRGRWVALGATALCVVGWAVASAAPLRPHRDIALLAPGRPVDQKSVEFNRDIRPILADNCYACHGPDKNQRKADLRLDVKESALADRGGYQAVQPGKPEKSELIRRITSTNPEVRMPSRKFGKQLTPRQIDLLRRWVEQGAEWQDHWSRIAPARPSLPAIAGSAWPKNAIDFFVLDRLKHEGLEPSPEADKRTLARRLFFDLVGLPPTPQEVDAFLADTSSEAYERLVDRLLASPHYGERMAMYWLDVVRYADTNGYHGDNHHDIALYRDYVINGFNTNKPFDQFTAEQLGGDLLPNPTMEQKIASGYNRLLMVTREGGAQAKEYMAKYAADRVRNFSTAWLGATMGCAECHDHKFDPFLTRDFYRLEAFFADIKETAVGEQEPFAVPTPEQAEQLRRYDEQVAAVRKTLDTATPELAAAQKEWEAKLRPELIAEQSAWSVIRPAKVESSGGATLTVKEDESVLASGGNPAMDTYTVTLETDCCRINGVRLDALTDPGFPNKGLARGNGNFVLTRFEVDEVPPNGGERKAIAIADAIADFSQNGYPIKNVIDPTSTAGWAVEGHVKPANHTAVFTFAQPLAGGPGTTLIIRMKHESPFAQHNIGHFRFAVTSDEKPALPGKAAAPAEVATALVVEPERRTPAQKEAIAKHYRSVAPLLEPARKELADVQKQKDALQRALPRTLVTVAMPPRTIRVLPRGNWLDDSGDVVEPGVPASLAPLKVEGRRANRLDLAHWLTAAENPLAARVFVNRLWKILFGQGLVKTLDDFGSQGAWPTHPELLDWLAVEFRESGWNVKHMMKLMVMSRAYRQSSAVSEALRQHDPYNILLGRQGRYRLDAEMVRDSALAISGLLSRKMLGPSVKPYQPPLYWAYLNFPQREWQADHGDNLYRRGVYTYWCRTFLHPSLLAFDAPTREEGCVERPRSNTPLQALVLLNDPEYVEAARAFAERIVREGGSSLEPRIEFAYREALTRKVEPAELKLLTALYQRHLAQFQSDKKSAEDLLHIGERPLPKELDAAELAAWTSVARVIFNLHEVITRN